MRIARSRRREALLVRDAVADAGTTFDAWTPTWPLEIPRMFSDGCVIKLSSLPGAPSVPPSQNSFISSGLAPSTGASRRMVLREEREGQETGDRDRQQAFHGWPMVAEAPLLAVRFA